MLTEFGGAPVDGGTIPALIFADIVNTYEPLEAPRTDAEEDDRRHRRPGPTAPRPGAHRRGRPTPRQEPAPTEPAPSRRRARRRRRARADAGATPAPSGGGVSPG